MSELGTIEYKNALDVQENLVALRQESKIPDTLLLLEHPHVYTTGRRFNPSHLLLGEEDMVRFGISMFHTDRGGEVTYHGPGQLVGYPILEIAGIPMIRFYLRALEETLICAVLDFGILAERMPGHPGVWVGPEKLASIGLRIGRGVSKHGFALNVSTDLSYFNGIIPCGLYDAGVTSMSKLLGREIPVASVRESVIRHFAQVFGRNMTFIAKDTIYSLIDNGVVGKAMLDSSSVDAPILNNAYDNQEEQQTGGDIDKPPYNDSDKADYFDG
ncbi:MAG TPA: lipoyl(octanoyl) transferase LipB [Candidatus Aquicultor sp.]